MLKQIHLSIRVTTLAATIGLSLLPHANAQITPQEFQMGRAREACRNQAQQQRLTFNRVVSTEPISGSGGKMIGSEVILNVSRAGSTYDVLCTYDNASRSATISSTQGSGGSNLPTEGNFIGKGLASGSVFGPERETDASLNFNGKNFSLSLAVPPGTGAQVNYQGKVTRMRGTGSTNSNSFILQGTVRTFASSTNNLQVVNTTGNCTIEVFDARVISTSCNTTARESSTRFRGMNQF